MGTLSDDQVTREAPAAPLDLSVVVPCFDCAETVGATIGTLTAYLDGTGMSWEVIMVDDGSHDGTGDVLDRHADSTRIRVIRLPRNRGKGQAVAAGMLQARGSCRIFTDADLPYSLDAIPLCVAGIQEGRAAVFGNRLLATSDSRVQPWVRRGLGRVVQSLVGVLLGRRDVDTQCGFKGFAGPVADIVFRDLRVDGFLFDVEVTLLLTRAGVGLDFVPVTLVNHDKSTIRLFPTGVRTLVEGLRVVRTGAEQRQKVAALGALYLKSKT